MLQRALLARVPDGVIEYSKKLVAIVREGEGEKTENRNTDKDIKTKKETQGTQDEYPQRLSNHRRHRGAILFFADGSQTRADLVVAADGLHSVVRRSLFPEHKMHFTGKFSFPPHRGIILDLLSGGHNSANNKKKEKKTFPQLTR